MQVHHSIAKLRTRASALSPRCHVIAQTRPTRAPCLLSLGPRPREITTAAAPEGSTADTMSQTLTCTVTAACSAKPTSRSGDPAALHGVLEPGDTEELGIPALGETACDASELREVLMTSEQILTLEPEEQSERSGIGHRKYSKGSYDGDNFRCLVTRSLEVSSRWNRINGNCRTCRQDVRSKSFRQERTLLISDHCVTRDTEPACGRERTLLKLVDKGDLYRTPNAEMTKANWLRGRKY